MGTQNTVREVFREYITDDALLNEIGDGIVHSVKLDSENRKMNIKVAFNRLVKRQFLFQLENSVAVSKLALNGCQVFPIFSSELFNIDYFTELIAELKRRNSSLNGTLNDATATISDEIITIDLKHGGAAILLSKNFPMMLQKLIQSEFKLNYSVVFSGVTSVDGDSEAYLEKQKNVSETYTREITENFVNNYEANIEFTNEQKEKREKSASTFSEVRSEDELLPKILPSTIRPLYGNMIKGNMQKIKDLAHDSGRVVIWGDIFS
ncbi:MAG: hypothetical protein Q8876_02410 [Bacillota bacterium]|nr:hypothetical protein [Bacillota bacterium]